MSNSETWMGRPIDQMSREELVGALKAAVPLLRSVNRNVFMRPEVEVKETAAGTVVARTFNWAFIPAGHLWSDEDRRTVQARLDAFAHGRGLHGAVVRFSPDRLEVEVPRPLQIEQLLALQKWLEAEKDMLDLAQVP